MTPCIGSQGDQRSRSHARFPVPVLLSFLCGQQTLLYKKSAVRSTGMG
jgi:hypothetical protein